MYFKYVFQLLVFQLLHNTGWSWSWFLSCYFGLGLVTLVLVLRMWSCLHHWLLCSDVNKDWTSKDKDKNKDQAYKDQDKDKDLNLVL